MTMTNVRYMWCYYCCAALHFGLCDQLPCSCDNHAYITPAQLTYGLYAQSVDGVSELASRWLKLTEHNAVRLPFLNAQPIRATEALRRA
jgi:hypothetical protein